MGWIIVEYVCEPCRLRIEAMVERPPPDRVTCANCMGEAERVLSAPRVKTPLVTVERGKGTETPAASDTSRLADGMTLVEWRRERRERRRDERRALWKKNVG